MRDHADHLVAEAVRGGDEAGCIIEREVDFLVRGVEGDAGRVGDAVHRAEDECYGAGWGDVDFGRAAAVEGGIEVFDYLGDGVGKEAGTVDLGEEGGCCRV